MVPKETSGPDKAQKKKKDKYSTFKYPTVDM